MRTMNFEFQYLNVSLNDKVYQLTLTFSIFFIFKVLNLFICEKYDFKNFLCI